MRKMGIFAVMLIAVAAGCGTTDSFPTTTVATQAGGGGGVGGGSTQKSKPEKPALTVAQQNAVQSAKDYLNTQAFSRTGLIGQLSSSYGDGFAKPVATFAVDYLHVNWKAEAVKSAKEYLQTSSFSCANLIQQLESSYGEGFTHAQAVYGVHKTGLC